MKKLILIFALLVVACTSRTVFDERFSESGILSQPPFMGPADPESFKFAMVGDLHVGGTDTARLERILDQAQAEGDEFIVLLGDIVDKGEEISFSAVQQVIQNKGYNQKVITLLGNHDVFEEGWKFYKNLWGASHYVVDAGNSRFIVLDTADGTLGKQQFDWLSEELSKTSAKNIFLLTHYMPVVPGQRTYLRLANQTEAERLMKLASRSGVRGMYGGHYHSYCYETIEGVDYVVAGGGGGRRMEPVKEFFFVQVSVSGREVSYNLRTVN
jgi:3',5'-cyclic AMP phosphodiesterase CpdA